MLEPKINPSFDYSLDRCLTDVCRSVIDSIRANSYQAAFDATNEAISLVPGNKRLCSIRDFITTNHNQDLQATLNKTTTHQLFSYWTSAPYERQLYYHELQKDSVKLRDRFANARVPIEEHVIDIPDFERWLTAFPEMFDHYKGNVATIEKCLEHYLTYKELALTPSEVYIDIAASQSKWADILLSKGYNTYKLDLAYPPGIRGREIGADAGNTGLQDNCSSVLSLHCAYETFINDADIRFIREAGRILKPGGRLAIVPLYTDERYFIMSCAHLDLSDHQLDGGAIRVWREDDCTNASFSRHYSPESFADRIYSQRGVLQGKVIYFNNLEELRRRYEGQRIYCDFMFVAHKP